MARPPAPEGTVVQGADGSYQVKRNGQWVASDASGQPTAAPLSGAPDTVGRRQEYTAGMKQIAADLARLRSTDNLDASLDQFDTANSQVSTGPGRAGGNLNPVNLLANMDQNYNDMQAAAGMLQVGSVPQGQGAVSDFERRLYAMGSPNLTNMGPTNRSIITNMRATRLEEADRIAFMQQYIAKNGTLNGADAQWRSYIATNPYTRRRPIQGGGTQLFMNDGRTPWAQYFAGQGQGQGGAPAATPTPTARPSPQPAARPAATPQTARPATPAASLPPAARAALKEGQNVTFGNGQTWTLRNGQPVRLR